jgi:class 3 adenylate cyclase
MLEKQTVVFTDLHGSTAVFEALGNARATEVVTGYNSALSRTIEAHHGHVVKTLGDGLLAIFKLPQQGVDAAVAIQRQHLALLSEHSVDQRMPVRIGLSSGDIEWVNGDCYGDAVNVASRLCDLCGPGQIWANETTIRHANEIAGINFRSLGGIAVRGRTEPCSVYQVEWHPDSFTDAMTVLGNLDPEFWKNSHDALGREIVLNGTAQSLTLHAFDLPVSIGRVSSNRFVVSDPRVSRTHAQLCWKNGAVTLEDLSSYGTWVRFDGSPASDVLLRRSTSVLHGSGAIALGASFSDIDAPLVRFSVS